jgi:hypothetical protein
MIKISKKMLLITILFLLTLATTYAAYCEFACVHCGMVSVSGCGSPPGNWGYCSRSPNHQHMFVITRQSK